MPPPSADVTIQLNGEPRALPAGATVADLVTQLDLGAGRFAVELNREIIPRSRLGERVLESGDAVEIIGFVGGG